MYGDIDRIRDALCFIPPDDRDTWLKMGMAIKSAVGDTGFDAWDAWSRQAHSYDTRDARDVWKSIRANGKVTVGTLFHKAKASGWCDAGTHPKPEDLAKRKRLMEKRTAQEEAEIALERAHTAKKAAAIWKAATEAKADNPYLARKRIQGHGARLHEGNLVVPVSDGRVLHSLQFIDPEGNKRFLTGGRTKGCYYSIGTPNGVVCIVEGFATGARVHEATGHAVAVAFSAGNLKAVAATLRAKLGSEVILVICADDDHATEGNPGLTKAKVAAEAVGCYLHAPKFTDEQRSRNLTDFADLGPEEAKKQLCAFLDPLLSSSQIDPNGRAIEQAKRLIVSVLDELKADPGRPFEADVLQALNILEDQSPPEFQRARSKLKQAGVSWRGIEKSREQIRERDTDHAEAAPYSEQGESIFWNRPTADGSVPTLLANFTARIVTDLTQDDGAEQIRVFEIEASHKGRKFRFSMPASEFQGMGWVAKNLGATAIVTPGFTIKDRLRAAIQTLSADTVMERKVFAHTGWRKVGDRWVYLSADKSIGAEGVAPDLEVLLQGKLASYALPEPGGPDDVRASLQVFDVASDVVTIPVLLAAYRSVLGNVDFGVHVAGATGQGKSELAALAMQHFGATFDARNFPTNWDSTGNSIEVDAFTAKDALLVVDDFAPSGTRNDAERLHKEATRVFRAQGNQSGRGRLRSDSSRRPTRYPRGLVMSTGEDTPKGHSIRARLLIVEFPQGDMRWDRLTHAQHAGATGAYARAMAAFLQWLAPRIDTIREELPALIAGYRQGGGPLMGPQMRLSNSEMGPKNDANPLIDRGAGPTGPLGPQMQDRPPVTHKEYNSDAAASPRHKRTTTIIGNLLVGWYYVRQFILETGACTESDLVQYDRRIVDALDDLAEVQASHHQSADPVPRFFELLQSAIASGAAHIAGEDGGEPSREDQPEAWGWRRRIVGTGDYERPEWQHQGERIGWVVAGVVYLDRDAAYKIADRQGDGITLTTQTLVKRLAERGMLVFPPVGRDGKQRYTVKVELEGRRRRVLHIRNGVFQDSKLSSAPEVGQVGQVGPEPRNPLTEHRFLECDSGPQILENKNCGPVSGPPTDVGVPKELI